MIRAEVFHKVKGSFESAHLETQQCGKKPLARLVNANMLLLCMRAQAVADAWIVLVFEKTLSEDLTACFGFSWC